MTFKLDIAVSISGLVIFLLLRYVFDFPTDIACLTGMTITLIGAGMQEMRFRREKERVRRN